MTRKRPLRRVAVTTLTVGLFVTVAACGSESGGVSAAPAATGPVTVRWVYGSLPTSADLPVLKGLADGWFQQAGINVAATPGGEIDQLQSVGVGEHDITVAGGVELLMGQEQGLPVEAVGTVQPLALNALLCRPGRSITASDPKSLLGQKLATATAGQDAGDVVWQIWRDEHDLTGRVEEVSPGAGLPLLFQEVVDCYPDSDPLAVYQAQEAFDGVMPVKFWYAKDVGVIGQVLEVNTAFAAKNPQAVKAFVGVFARGMQWAAQNQAAAVALMKTTYPETDPALTAKELRAMGGYWTGWYQKKNGFLAMNDDSWTPTVQVLKASGQLKKLPDLARVYSAKFLPDKPYLP